MCEILRLNDVSYSYKGTESDTLGVKGINLSVSEGEFLVLVGKNGCGKSTLAKLMNGFILPDRGEVYAAGIPTSDESRIFEIRRTIGMVFQNPDNQTVASIVEDDIAFGPENLGIEREEIQRRVDFSLSAVGMLDYKSGTPFKLSGGQKQRLAIAAILAMKPKVLILDESTAMLDPKGRKEVLEVVKKLNKEDKITVILITHFMEEAIQADRIVVMNDGEIVKIGEPKEIFKDTKSLKNVMLEAPLSVRIAEKLRELGYDISYGALTDSELVEEICRLK